MACIGAEGNEGNGGVKRNRGCIKMKRHYIAMRKKKQDCI